MNGWGCGPARKRLAWRNPNRPKGKYGTSTALQVILKIVVLFKIVLFRQVPGSTWLLRERHFSPQPLQYAKMYPEEWVLINVELKCLRVIFFRFSIIAWQICVGPNMSLHFYRRSRPSENHGARVRSSPLLWVSLRHFATDGTSAFVLLDEYAHGRPPN